MIKLKFVYGVLPCVVQYTDNLPEWCGGRAIYNFIQIRPKYLSDTGLLTHELTHVKQCYRGLFLIYGIRYKFFKDSRFNYELEAYVSQIKTYGSMSKEELMKKIELFAKFISEKYKLDKSVGECESALTIKLLLNR